MLTCLFLVAAAAPYPDEWIVKARTDNVKLSCQELVYKKGCKETRTGKVSLHVELTPEGTVSKASITKNAIRRDPKLVGECLLKNIKKWSFTPPKDVEASLELEVLFGDKC